MSEILITNEGSPNNGEASASDLDDNNLSSNDNKYAKLDLWLKKHHLTDIKSKLNDKQIFLDFLRSDETKKYIDDVCEELTLTKIQTIKLKKALNTTDTMVVITPYEDNVRKKLESMANNNAKNMDILTNNINIVTKEHDTCMNNINDEFDQIITKIEQRKSELINELNDKKTLKITSINNDIKLLNDSDKNIKNCQDNWNKMLRDYDIKMDERKKKLKDMFYNVAKTAKISKEYCVDKSSFKFKIDINGLNIDSLGDLCVDINTDSVLKTDTDLPLDNDPTSDDDSKLASITDGKTTDGGNSSDDDDPNIVRVSPVWDNKCRSSSFTKITNNGYRISGNIGGWRSARLSTPFEHGKTSKIKIKYHNHKNSYYDFVGLANEKIKSKEYYNYAIKLFNENYFGLINIKKSFLLKKKILKSNDINEIDKWNGFPNVTEETSNNIVMKVNLEEKDIIELTYIVNGQIIGPIKVDWPKSRKHKWYLMVSMDAGKSNWCQIIKQ